MFRWCREIERLDIESDRVRRVFRSLGDVQVALAGLPSQEATAFLCVFAVKGGLQVTVALHLPVSGRMVFYFPREAVVVREQIGGRMDEGIRFLESMGFMMGDTDIHLRDPAGKEALWDSLPLRRGAAVSAKVQPAAKPAPSESPGQVEAVQGPSETPDRTGSKSAGEPATLVSDRIQPARSEPPSPREMLLHRKKFLENLGRFLSSF